MGIVVDTNVFIDAESDRLNLASLLAGDDHYFLAAITVSELLTGVTLATNPADRIHRLIWSESIIETMPILSFDLDVARTYAEVYAYQLQHTSRRQSLSVHDLQIAATAIVHDYAVLTSNAGDFKQIPGLRLLTP
ncbi:MAG: PIN domain-containing protein [Sedimenticola sp.]